ncbi:thiamine pyrophosphate-binding protein [Thalassobaculum litoreum]|uniref:Acetolactate synthase-1/2/3 large subunit n=1 Tax=Thalassobaculum litoreum DSM 18839 TaxID=1123362 RepID=A0A8G2ETV6_9PROT|nr:thiamine pyrophosphate-binding protein [Thalassobaculum litoreum]SDF04450.1 acetolactate synthase-1/2/3 large subunit [Thalassobaculum litoreum DSM 18839]
MAETYRVGDLVADFLQRMDVETVFGIVSVHNIPTLDAIGRRNAIRFVTARSEYGGGHMADAYARVHGGLGVLISSTGPGAANAVPALVEAGFASTPLLHITGQTPTAMLDRDMGPVHDVPGQSAMLASVCKSAYRILSPGQALGILTRAVADALTAPTGPVSVEIPIDVQRAEIPRPAELETLTLPRAAADLPDDASLSALVDTVKAAKRPLLWVGNGAKHATGAVQALVDLGIPVISSWNGRGAVPEDHPLSLAAGAGLPEIQAFLDTVDLLIVAGSRLRGHETQDQSLALPARRVQIDIDGKAQGRTYTTDLFVRGAAGATLSALAGRLAGGLSLDPALAGDVAAARKAAKTAYSAFLDGYAAMPEIVRRVLPRDGVFVRDVTLSHTTWGHKAFEVYGPRDTLYPVGAAIGPGLSMGIGAALGAGGRKTLCISGDGGFAMNLGELWTAADEQADVVFLVMNDHGFGVIKHIQDSLYGGRHHFADPTPPDFKRLADGSGMPYAVVRSMDALEAALSEALAVPGPALVEVDMAAIGPYPRYYTPPPYAKG